MKILKKLIPVIIVLFLSFWAVKPLFVPGFFPMHDDTQVARVFEMNKSLTDGMFPVRWVSDLGYGYGYPIFNFYAPFAYYVGALFMFLGFDALNATKIMIGLGTVLSGVFMYFFAKEFWGKVGGIVAAILYVYAPYHGLNIYVRGAIAELWAYCFIPLVFLGVYKVFLGLKMYTEMETSSKFKVQSSKFQLKIKSLIWNWASITAITYAAIIVSHNLTAMMVTPFLFIFSIFLYIKMRMSEKIYKPHFILLGILLGIFLGAFYWVPAILEMKFTDVLSVVGGGSDYKDHFICITQLWNSPWGFGGSVPGCADGTSFKIGKFHILLGLISLLALVRLWRMKDKTVFQIATLFFAFLIISVFLTINESKFIWDGIPHMAFFQFPWRFLALVSFFLSFIGGAIIIPFDEMFLRFKANQPRGLSYVIGATVITLTVFINSDVFVPQKILNAKSDDYTNKEILNWKISKISDEYMPPRFFKPLRPVDVPKRRFESGNKSFKVLSITEKTQEIKALVSSSSKDNIIANIAYFPGFHVFIDDKQVWFKYSGQGLLIDIPKGNHKLEIRFTQTPVEKIGNTASLTGVIILLAGIISHRKKKIYG